MSGPSLIRRALLPRTWPHRWTLLAGVGALFLTNWLTVTIPMEVGAAIDGLTTNSPIGGHAAAIAGMGLAVILVRTLSRVWFFNPGRDVEYTLRADLFAHLLAQQPSFYAGRRTGDIISRASNDITNVRVLIGFGMMQAVNTTFAIGLTLWKMLTLSPLLTLLGGLPILVAGVGVQLGIRQLMALFKLQQQQLGQLSDHVLESFQGVATIQGFVAEEAFEARFEERNLAWLKTGLKVNMIAAMVFGGLMFAGGLSIFSLLRFGGPMAIAGTLSVGALGAFAALIATLLPALRSLGFMLNTLQRGQVGLERIVELLDAPVDRPEGSAGLRPAGEGGPGFQIRGLHFAYPDDPEHPVLQDVSVDVPPGSVVGLVGRTGSGKSTLLSLLLRLYNPPRGSVKLVDSTGGPVDLLDLDLDAWRRRIAVAPQRPFLFSNSIAENIAMDEAPDLEAVEAAAALAALGLDLDSMPNGLDTVVGERGIMLSGGQRQRVALARALFDPGDVIVLDDVLSAVDHQTEARLVDTLRALGRSGRRPTTFIASHRLSALRHADLILVLQGGRLTDQGTHAQLLSRPGLYRETWEAQELSQGERSAQEAP